MKDKIYIVVVGDDNTGKTCLLTTYTTNTFKEGIVPTIGNNWFDASAMVDGKQVQLVMLDAFRRFTPASYHGADVFVVLFDLNDPERFPSVKND